DDGVIVADSNAILVYLAKKAGRTDWLPEDPEGAARVQRWLSVAAGEVAYGPGAARLVALFGAPFHADEVIGRAHALLEKLENHLAGRDWLAAGHPTIADIAIYSYVVRAPEGHVDLDGYAAVNRLLRRIEALPGFVPFAHPPAQPAAGPAPARPALSALRLPDANNDSHPAQAARLARGRDLSSRKSGGGRAHAGTRTACDPRLHARPASRVLCAVALCRAGFGR